MQKTIDITGLDKAQVLRLLYNRARPIRMGFLHYDPADMTVEEAKQILDDYSQHENGLYFDYLKGRVMKVRLDVDKMKTLLYDRDNGEGAALEALSPLLSGRIS